MALDPSTFNGLAGSTLEGYYDAIEEALGHTLEVDFEEGILTIELESGGQYVINRHAPNRQIWMSSPVSGATHFNYDEESSGWTSSRGAGVLSEMLADELSAATGTDISLK